MAVRILKILLLGYFFQMFCMNDDDDDESQVEAGKVALLECRVTHLSPHHTVSWLRLFSSSVSALLVSLTEVQQERRCLRADCGRSRLQLGPPFARCHQVQVGSLSTNDHHQLFKKMLE